MNRTSKRCFAKNIYKQSYVYILYGHPVFERKSASVQSLMKASDGLHIGKQRGMRKGGGRECSKPSTQLPRAYVHPNRARWPVTPFSAAQPNPPRIKQPSRQARRTVASAHPHYGKELSHKRGRARARRQIIRPSHCRAYGK